MKTVLLAAAYTLAVFAALFALYLVLFMWLKIVLIFIGVATLVGPVFVLFYVILKDMEESGDL